MKAFYQRLFQIIMVVVCVCSLSGCAYCLKRLYWELALLDEREKDYSKAVNHWSTIIALDPLDKQAYWQRGIVYMYHLNEDRKAIADFSRCIELDHKDYVSYDCRAGAFDDLGEYQKALDDYAKATELSPDPAHIYNDRAETYAHLKQYQKAIDDCSTAIDMDPNLSDAFDTRGEAYFALKQYQNAIKDFTKEIELEESDGNLPAEIYLSRGEVHDKLTQYDKAIADFSKAIEDDPDLAEAYHNRAEAYKYIGKKDLAQKDEETAKKLEHKATLKHS